MLKSVALLTPASLERSLTAIEQSADTEACSAALLSAAELMQEAVLSNQSSESFTEALNSCPANLSGLLDQVIDRAINFHQLPDGGTLGFWLLPINIVSPRALPPTLALATTDGMAGLRVGSALLKQLKLSVHDLGANATLGWTYPLDTLYSHEALEASDLSDLMHVPLQARDVVTGFSRDVDFKAGQVEFDDAVLPPAGSHQYYLPVVVYHPAGASITLPEASEQMMYRVNRWIERSMPADLLKDLSIRIASQPQPFSVGMVVGRRMLNDFRMRGLIGALVSKSGVEPNGMAALVSLYQAQNRNNALTVGVSLVSRLTGNNLATINLQISTDDGREELALTTHVLKDLGIESTVHNPYPVPTIACQHCGKLQFAMPPAELINKDVEPTPEGTH